GSPPRCSAEWVVRSRARELGGRRLLALGVRARVALGLALRLRGAGVSGVLLLPVRGLVIEVGVPAAALENEVAAADQAARLHLAALGALLDRIFRDALLELPLVPARVASVLVSRHPIPPGGR